MITVTTPTGQVGRQLISLLLHRDEAVRVIVRDASRLDASVRERVEVVEGSHADAAALGKALTDTDALFWLVPPNPAASSAQEHYLDFARAGAAAIRRHGVGHVVAVSSAGHGWTEAAGVLSAAFAMDAELAASGAAYRALSLPFYMENLLGQVDGIRDRGAFALSSPADHPLPMIATRDIAEHAARLLSDRTWSGQENLPLFSPDRLTPTAAAQVMSEELGRPIAFQHIALDDFAAMLRSRGASERLISDMAEAFAAQVGGIYEEDWRIATIADTDFRTWCREVLKPLAS